MQLSNKTLIYLISIALLITLFGTAFNLSRLGLVPSPLTGAATTLVGNASVTITTLTSINMSTSNISWGSGYVNAGQTKAILDTMGNYVTGGTWSNVGAGFLLENIGNVDVNVTFQNNENAITLIGGTNPAYNYTTEEDEGDSCDDSTGGTLAVNKQVNNSAAAAQELCGNFSFVDSKDRLEIHLNLTIPYDSLTGYKEDTWVFTAAQKT